MATRIEYLLHQSVRSFVNVLSLVYATHNLIF
jgi:hypothetical protein